MNYKKILLLTTLFTASNLLFCQTIHNQPLEKNLNLDSSNISGQVESITYTENSPHPIVEDQEEKSFNTLQEETGFPIIFDRLWMTIAALLVFFMQAGFKVFEVGLVRKIDGNSVGFKNLMDWLIVTLVFFLFGFGLMFGESNGVFGKNFGLSAFTDSSINVIGNYGYEFFYSNWPLLQRLPLLYQER